jgi:two-component system alkaline phosphatase synthesis response regulator PhoP
MQKEKIKILVVDDEPDILEILKLNLQSEGYKVSTAENGKKALKKADKINPDLIVLDLMMPIMDGIETCERLRLDSRYKNKLIIFLTARSEDYSQIAALDVGADDYITKPVKPRVFLSKIKSLLRRKLEPNDSILKYGNLSIDPEEYKVILSGKEIILPKKEFELLFLLASKPKKIFKREKIMSTVWGYDVVVGDRTIDVHIRKLREKIGEKYFKTIKGVGYKFVN